MDKKYLKKGCNNLNYGDDALNAAAKKIILSDAEFVEGLKNGGVSNETIWRLEKMLGGVDDVDDAAFTQNLVIIANKETGKEWFASEGLITVELLDM